MRDEKGSESEAEEQPLQVKVENGNFCRSKLVSERVPCINYSFLGSPGKQQQPRSSGARDDDGFSTESDDEEESPAEDDNPAGR